METWATRRTPIAIGEEPLDRLLRADEVGTLVEASDAIVLSASLNSTTAGMVNSQLLGRMRVGAYLVNVARGGLIDQDALVSALASGRIGGAVLDVTEPEPLPKGHPLRVAPNTSITPHISGDTAEGRNRSLSDLCRTSDALRWDGSMRWSIVWTLREHLQRISDPDERQKQGATIPEAPAGTARSLPAYLAQGSVNERIG